MQKVNIVFQRVFLTKLWPWYDTSEHQERIMTEFTTVARIGDIAEGQGRSFAVNGTMVGVFLSQGKYLAINDFCPHMGASLAEGHVEDDAVMCPWHAWRFSLKDGTWLDNSKSKIKSACYEVRIEGNEIQVSVPKPPDGT